MALTHLFIFSIYINKYIFFNFFQSIGTKPLPSLPKDVIDDDLLFNDEIDCINKQKLPEVSVYNIKKFLIIL